MTELKSALPKPLNTQDLLFNIRILISERCGVAVEYIRLNSDFCDDLGLDWLDVIELTVFIEQQFPGLAIAEDGLLASLDDLIQNIQVVDNAENKDAGWCGEQHGHLHLVS